MASDLPIHNYVFYSGAKISRRVTWLPGEVPFDFTGIDVRVVISRRKGLETPDLILTVGNGVNVIDAVNGVIEFNITKSQSLLLDGVYYYDIELDVDGDLILTGTMHFTRDV